MLLANPSDPTHNDAAPGILSGSAARQMLSRGELGAKLVQMARVAAALHMAQSTAPRNDGAQIVPRTETTR